MEIVSNPTHFLSSSSSSSRRQFPRFFSTLSTNSLLHLSHGVSTAITRRCILSLPKSASLATTVAVANGGNGGSELGNDAMLEARRKAADLSLRGTSIFLVGMKSSMKTSLGKLLAEVFNYYYFDSDDVVEQAAGGSSAAESFRESDEDGFRSAETEVLKQLSSMVRLVVCAGDGAVQSSTNLALLRDGISLWVDIPLTMTASMTSDDSSPEFLSAFEELRGGYGTADGTISLQRVAAKLGYETLDSVTPEDMLLEVLSTIEKLMSAKKMMEAAAAPF